MTEFGGWQMPVQYEGIVAEHHATRQGAGLFDTCHMGQLVFTGSGAGAFLDRLMTRRLSDMAVGQCRYGLMCQDDGGIIDDCITYRLGEDRFMVVTNAGTLESDHAHFQTQRAATRAEDVEIRNASDETGKIDIQGPLSREILQRLTDAPLSELRRFHAVEFAVAGVPAIISRTGYTGEPGYELYLPADRTPAVWDALMNTGQVKPAGLGARDTLRLEAALPLYGADLSTDINPLEAGQSWCVDLDKDFLGAEALRRVKAEGPSRRMYGFRMQRRIPARHGATVYADDAMQEALGTVTSGSYGPTVEAAIGLALLKARRVKTGSPITIDIRGRAQPAVVVKRPFYRSDSDAS
jgi:aminomethyltransferase